MRRTGTILWREIEKALLLDIANGAYQPGAQLPVELELAQRFGVNRHTIRQALAGLQERGAISIEQGRGTFVRPPKLRYPVTRRTRYRENVAYLSQNGRGVMLRTWRAPATAELAADLNVPAGSDLVAIDDLREMQGEPVSLTTHYFPAARFSRLPAYFAECGSITEALSRLGVTDYMRRVTRVHARGASDDEARLLGQVPGAPVLVVESVNIDADGCPIEMGSSRSAGGRWELIFEPDRL